MKKIIYLILLLPLHLLAQYTGGNGDGYVSKIGQTVFAELNPGVISGTQTVCVDEDPLAFVSEQAAYGDGTITYQWEYSLNNINWTEIDGATSEVYDSPELGSIVTAPQNVYAKRRAENGSQIKYSNTVVITVNDCVKYYSIKVKHSEKVLDVESFGGEGSNVWQYESLGGTNQLWSVNDNGDGYFWLEPKHATGQCLEIGGWSTEDGGNVIIWTFFGNDNQLWYVQDADEGYYRIVNKHSDKSLEVESASMDNMANVLQNPYEANDNEKFIAVASTLENINPLLPFVKGQALSDKIINLEVGVSPNPFTNSFNISLNNKLDGGAQYSLIDLNGRVITQGELISKSININVRNIENGIYILKLSNGNKVVDTVKLVKQ